MRLRYKIDGNDLATAYSIVVSMSHGLFEPAKRKIAYKHNWQDEDGEDVDLSTFIKEAREVKLDCFIKGTSATSVVANFKSFMSMIDQPGVRYLVVDVVNPDSVIENFVTVGVYREDQPRLQKRLGSKFWTFQLVLKEVAGYDPNPPDIT